MTTAERLTREQIERLRTILINDWENAQDFNALCDTALQALQSDGVLVPMEPTEEMRLAGAVAIQHHYLRDGGWCGLLAAREQMMLTWNAMLAARPSQRAAWERESSNTNGAQVASPAAVHQQWEVSGESRNKAGAPSGDFKAEAVVTSRASSSAGLPKILETDFPPSNPPASPPNAAPSLSELLKAACLKRMTPEELFEQKVSIIYGMQKLSTPGRTLDEIRAMLRADVVPAPSDAAQAGVVAWIIEDVNGVKICRLVEHVDVKRLIAVKTTPLTSLTPSSQHAAGFETVVREAAEICRMTSEESSCQIAADRILALLPSEPAEGPK